MGRLLASGVLEPDGYRVIGSTGGFDDSHVVVLVTTTGGKRPSDPGTVAVPYPESNLVPAPRETHASFASYYRHPGP
jgi:hypothetical protein